MITRIKRDCWSQWKVVKWWSETSLEWFLLNAHGFCCFSFSFSFFAASASASAFSYFLISSSTLKENARTEKRELMRPRTYDFADSFHLICRQNFYLSLSVLPEKFNLKCGKRIDLHVLSAEIAIISHLVRVASSIFSGVSLVMSRVLLRTLRYHSLILNSLTMPIFEWAPERWAIKQLP